MRISVVIPALNEEAALPGLLEASLGQTRCPDEIIVVDAESTDRTSDIVAQWAQSGSPVRCIKGRRGGCGIGRNIGIKAARNSWIVLLDCGMLPPSSWLALLEAMHHQTGAPAVFGTCQYIPETVFQRSLCAVAWGSRPVPVVPCALFHRSVFEAIGLFREDLEAVEDREWINRFLRHYGSLCVMQEAVTPHLDIPDDIKSVYKKWFLYSHCAVRAGVLRGAQVLYLIGVPLSLFILAYSWQAALGLILLYGGIRGIWLPLANGTPLAWLIKPANLARVSTIASVIDIAKALGFAAGHYSMLQKPTTSSRC
jgi:glycosyltransferase involved in cell wall biosynthesis